MDAREKELIKGIRQGDLDTFALLFDRYYVSLARYAMSLVKEVAVAEDIVQDLFLNLWENRELIEIEQSLEGYLFRIIYYQSIKHIRQQIAVREKTDDLFRALDEAEALYSLGEPAYHDIDHQLLKKEVSEAIDELPEKTRIIFQLSRRKSLTNREIAKTQGIHIKTVEYHISRALIYLRDRLKNT